MSNIGTVKAVRKGYINVFFALVELEVTKCDVIGRKLPNNEWSKIVFAFLATITGSEPKPNYFLGKTEPPN